ncbi:hypothetical protein E2C01_065911 [Portunus trituberculatus]|uniref:Uncharacterized protein n=1 Tax=Portunus trituberculatus TaxID=210409 RepID=A0A5B7HQY7_PORTR|nr:hypothetical protein [Portunus trituberculatus]
MQKRRHLSRRGAVARGRDDRLVLRDVTEALLRPRMAPRLTVFRPQEGLGVADVPSLFCLHRLTTSDASVLGDTKINSDRNSLPL